MQQVGDDRFRIGTIEFNAKTRELRLPATVELTEGLLEYLVVHGDGKIHEALLVTGAKPSEIQLALTLLRFQTSRELFPIITDDGTLTGKFPEVPEGQRAAARVRIDLEWTSEGRTRRCPAADWIMHSVSKKPMPPDSWILGGSEMQEGTFAADINGEIAAIYTSNTSLANFSGKDREDDTVWIPHPRRIPARGTKVTVIIAPYLANPQPPAKP